MSSDKRIRLFKVTVARPDFPSGWLLVEHPEQGYSSYAYPFLTLAAIASTFAVVFGEAGRDAHGDVVRVEPAPERAPTSDEMEAAWRRAWEAHGAPELSDLARTAAVVNLAAWELLSGLRMGSVTLPAPRLRLVRERRTILFGELAATPELHRLPSGATFLKMRVVARRAHVNADGAREEVLDEHAVTVWGGRAEGLARVLRRGRKLMVEGRPREREPGQRPEIDADDVILGPEARP